MAARRLAPTLRAWLDGGGYTLNEDLLAAASSELSALLAVARAAAAVTSDDPNAIPPWDRLDRALARLERASRKETKR